MKLNITLKENHQKCKRKEQHKRNDKQRKAEQNGRKDIPINNTLYSDWGFFFFQTIHILPVKD